MINLPIPHIETISAIESFREGGDYRFYSIEELIEELNEPN